MHLILKNIKDVQMFSNNPYEENLTAQRFEA
jgi:hypothetical protein